MAGSGAEPEKVAGTGKRRGADWDYGAEAGE